MSKAAYWQRGEAIDYVNETEEIIAANEIVPFGEHVGIAGTVILPGQLGTLHVNGVFEMPKADGEEIGIGVPVYYDTGAEAVTSSADGVQATDEGAEDEDAEDEETEETAVIAIGYAIAPSPAALTTVKVKLQG